MHLKAILSVFCPCKLSDVDGPAVVRVPQGAADEGFLVGVCGEGDGGYEGGEAGYRGLGGGEVRSGGCGGVS